MFVISATVARVPHVTIAIIVVAILCRSLLCGSAVGFFHRLRARQMSENGFDSPPLRWFVDYGCRDDYGPTLASTSAWAAFYYFCARETEEAIVWPDGLGTVRGLALAHIIA